ncbi:hypothetical protein KC19_11G118300 [Ceratodon purpureus]|uniref:Fungal lipase-type domain-containing protein n=1 Tax=Ceratodon purpureus TaxID=3225 RepID=A0A8T0GDI8_CERPU|nr:hypothetical protein KC19_11G118300 [Ceratodon purpureus]
MEHPIPPHTVSLPPQRRPSIANPPTPLGLQGTHNRTYQRPNHLQIGNRWREIQGANDWEGLLDPLDECLRTELIRYGMFAQAAYDAFDFDMWSQYCGSCRYSKENLFKEVDLHHTGYTVTMYIYATADVEVPYLLKRSEREDAWSSKSNWIGYVAVCTDEGEIKRLGRRDIMIAWRGSVTGLEWAANLEFQLTPCGLTDESKLGLSTHIKVEAGFLSLYTSAKEDSRFNKVSAQSYLVKEIKDLVEKYKDQDELSITVCGHSLGSALATLSAYDLAESDLNQTEVGGKMVSIPITVFSFAGPRVGNSAFKERLEAVGVKVLRVVNTHDRVPRVPGLSAFEGWLWTYSHVGVELEINDEDSQHLDQDKASIANHHNFEVYLHLIDGYGRWDVKPPSRDPLLVNKGTGFLKEDKYVPEAWFQPKHKGLVYSVRENRYYQPDRAIEDIPVPPKPETVAAAKAFTKSLTLKKSLEREREKEKGSQPPSAEAAPLENLVHRINAF